MFKGTESEFRHRYLTHVVIFLAGFAMPWWKIWPLHGLSTWLVLSKIPTHGVLSITATTWTIIALACLCAVAAAWLRVWGTAYLGEEIMRDGAMHGAAVVADGPYRRVRNPLYLGVWLQTLVLALLMHPLGAIFTVIAITVVELRLIGGEESFLMAKLGEAYAAYCARVPRLLPSITARVGASGRRARWGSAVLAEMYFLCVAVCFVGLLVRYGIFLPWHWEQVSYCVLGSLGVGIVAKAFLPRVTRL